MFNRHSSTMIRFLIAILTITRTLYRMNDGVDYASLVETFALNAFMLLEYIILYFFYYMMSINGHDPCPIINGRLLP